MDPRCSHMCRNAVSDVHRPPAYNWWTRLSLRKEPAAPENAPQENASLAHGRPEAGAERPLGLRLSTFHRALRKDDDPAFVERLIRAHLVEQRRRHEDTNRVRRANAVLQRERCGGANALVVTLQSMAGARVSKRGRVVRGRACVGIFESPRPLGGLRRFLAKRGASVLWEGRSPACFSDFKVVRYREGLENTAGLLFYKSVLIKALDIPPKLREEVEEEMRHSAAPTSEVEVRGDGQILYRHRGRRYETQVVRLPCIVESYKTFDNKQFCKIADISTLVVVRENGEALDARMLQNSGLTPPMKYVRVRRFRKRRVLQDTVEDVEAKVRELLEKDARAAETTIVYHDSEAEEEVKNIVEEIEASLFAERAPVVEKPPEEAPLLPEESAPVEETSEIDMKIARLEEAIKIAVNPILKKRFVDSLNELLERKRERK
ncbi:UNVERIFIED_CONTAM: hypothetical protein PYX00_011665 [Menopon gallinae]|uniref:TAFII55 protein conserved region domain-containing protein n=1 Tax=Menopon gallinae TaxID=328185 RepID=A0AAW2H889_9NEOP